MPGQNDHSSALLLMNKVAQTRCPQRCLPSHRTSGTVGSFAHRFVYTSMYANVLHSYRQLRTAK